MRKTPLIAAMAAFLALPALAQSQLTVVNFGGANGNAQKKAYFEPFEKSGGAKVVGVEYNGEQAKIKAMVEAKKVTWDVVEVESPDINRGCDEGLFEKLDWSKIGSKADFTGAAVHECGIGVFVWFLILTELVERLKSHPAGEWIQQSTFAAGVLLLAFGLYFSWRTVAEFVSGVWIP